MVSTNVKACSKSLLSGGAAVCYRSADGKNLPLVIYLLPKGCWGRGTRRPLRTTKCPLGPYLNLPVAITSGRVTDRPRDFVQNWRRQTGKEEIQRLEWGQVRLGKSFFPILGTFSSFDCCLGYQEGVKGSSPRMEKKYCIKCMKKKL